MNLKYKYLVVGYPYDYYWYCYHQLNEIENSYYVKSISFSPLINRLYGYDITYLNKISITKRLWVRVFLSKLKNIVNTKKWCSQENICFVFLAGGLNLELLRYGLANEIRKDYPNSKIVFYISDVSNKTRSYLPSIIENSDLAITFDPGDARKYNLLYHPIPYSKIDYKAVPIEYDLSFVGIAKERLDSLLSLCSYLSLKGVKCKFVIVNVPKSKQIECEGVEYCDWLEYKDNLDILLRSRCVLDFTYNSKCEGNTLRIGEAVMLDKKLLTNNAYIVNNGIYDSNYMSIFSSNENIDVDFLKSAVSAEYKIKEKLYPEDLLSLIDLNLK